MTDPAAAVPPNPAAAPSPESPPGPGGAPMLTPQKPAGRQATGRSKVQIASMILQQALSELGGIATEDGRAVLEILSKLGKVFGKSEDSDRKVMPAELANIMGKSPAPNPALAAASKPPMPQMPPGAA